MWMSAILPAQARVAGRPAVPEFWVLPIRGGMPVQILPIADSPNYAAPFSWLPDSRHIVSALPYPRPGVHLWITDTRSSSSRMITASGNVENDPAVSPDGLHLATTLQQANYDIYRLSIDRPALEPALASGRNEMDPAWSSKASQMAYTTDRSGLDEIWLRSPNGDFERPLVTPQDFSGQTYLLSSPEFSPDGQRIAYYRDGSTGSRIWISPVAGGPPVELARSDDAQDLPSWSPDGAWIAFGKDSGGVVGKWSLVKMRIGAKAAPETIVSDIVPLSPVKWSPNGAWIAYNGHGGLSLVSPDGQSTRTLYDEPLIAFAWSEDNRRLYGIRQSDDYKHLTFTSIDVESRSETVISQDFMAMPVAAQPVRGFARVSARSFMTSIVHVSSDIWLLDGFARPSSVWDRWAGLLRVPGR
jgi:Tol biopolymer transport system component